MLFEDAMKIAKRLRKKIMILMVKKLQFLLEFLKDDFKESLEKADKALYEAKRSGRNLVKGNE